MSHSLSAAASSVIHSGWMCDPIEATERDTCGTRGLSVPDRLAQLWKLDDCLSHTSSVPTSLLAPVMDRGAELAGSGENGVSFISPSVSTVIQAIDRSHGGLEDTLDLGRLHQNEPRVTTARLESARARLVQDLAPAISQTDLAMPVLNAPGKPEVIAKFQPASSLIPRSVETLAKPARAIAVKPKVRPARSLNVEPSALFQTNPAGWPQPTQLSQDLAAIETMHRIVRAGDNQTLASLSAKSPSSGSSASVLYTSPLFAMSSVQQESPSSLVHRQAVAVVMGRWAERVDAAIARLSVLPRIGDKQSGPILEELSTLAIAGQQLAEKVPVRDQQIRWLRTTHALARRVEVWTAVWGLVSKQTPGSEDQLAGFRLAIDNVAAKPSDVDSSAVVEAVRSLRNDLPMTGDQDGWNQFLLLEEIEDACKTDNAEERAIVAQRFLSRLSHHGLDRQHDHFLQRESVSELIKTLQPWTSKPIDYAKLLADIERQETDAIDLATIKIGEAFQTLRFSSDINAVKVAKAIDVNYRNANVRTSLSADLLRRLLPGVEDKTQPIATQVLGSQVRGTSHVQSSLGLQLQPSPNSWDLALTTRGNVSTQTRASQQGVVLRSTGQSRFEATTPVQIASDGIRLGATQVDVNGDQTLHGIQTKYDSVPVVRSIVRRIAENRYVESKPKARQISNSRIQSQVQQELQSELTAKRELGQKKLDELILGPLSRLNLNPRVIGLETTEDRLIARYRLAGDWQLASFTPRPRAWSDSMMSVQLHQSALNNTLERLLPTGEVRTFAQLFERIDAMFGGLLGELPPDVPADAEIEFASTRPVTFEIHDNRLWLTMRVVNLSQPGSPKLRRFIVRAAYRPEIDGLTAKLVRDGHLRISGPGMSMRQRLPIRAVFNKVLSDQRALPLTMPKLIDHPKMQDLAIAQLELRDGWLALAIAPITLNSSVANLQRRVIQ